MAKKNQGSGTRWWIRMLALLLCLLMVSGAAFTLIYMIAIARQQCDAPRTDVSIMDIDV